VIIKKFRQTSGAIIDMGDAVPLSVHRILSIKGTQAREERDRDHKIGLSIPENMAYLK
jgi:hypothetical protein